MPFPFHYPFPLVGVRIGDDHVDAGNSLGMAEQQYGRSIGLLYHGATLSALVPYTLTIPQERNKLLSYLSHGYLGVFVNVYLNYCSPIPSLPCYFLHLHHVYLVHRTYYNLYL